jgi:hypothetical protein
LIPEVREEQPERSLVEVADGELSLRAPGFSATGTSLGPPEVAGRLPHPR